MENGLRFQPLRIEPRSGELPNPVRVNFQDEIALVGWELGQRVVVPGELVHLTLYWDALALMDRTYTVSAQVLDANWLKVAQWDSLPGKTDTSTWQVGQRVIDRRTLEVALDAPPGGYELRLLIYDGQSLERMRIVNAEGRVLPNDFFVLGQIRIR